MLPGVTQVHVEAHRRHEPALVVIDAAPVGHPAFVLVRKVRLEVKGARHLEAVMQIENCVEDRVVVLNFHNWPVWKYPTHAGDEDLPFLCTMKVVAHEEPATEEILA